MSYFKSYEDVISLDGYIEGKYQHNLYLVLKHYGSFRSIDTTPERIYSEWYKEDLIETNEPYKCVCSHDIQYKFFAKNRNTGFVLLLGSECIIKIDKRFAKSLNRTLRRKQLPESVMRCKYCDRQCKDIYHNTCFKRHQKKHTDLMEELIDTYEDMEDALNHTMASHTKYGDKTLMEIYKIDKRYIKWMAEKCSKHLLKYFAKLVIRHFKRMLILV